MNRLSGETSPYLRQHQDNPVDWYPWGDEAFALARSTDRPILLSVGYSACHWCHVMAHESFEDADTAAVMNRLFVNVKVDREERPDVDAVYMDAVQAFTGRGGWPMTVFLTPDGHPFFGGTYFPQDRFVTLMERIAEAWQTDRVELVEQGDRITESLGRFARIDGAEDLPGLELIESAVHELSERFDRVWGGFGSAPKFPPSMSLDVIIRGHLRAPAPALAEMVTTTLDAMAGGGMYDHIGGGFARYSTDDRWLVPHFEKMLYDQALLTRSYLHGWQLTSNDDYLQVCAETIAWVAEDLRDPAGGFYSALDADSEGVEGAFYVWTPDEVTAVLGAGAAAANEWYGITDAGNFEGRSIPHRPLSAELGRPETIEAARRRLLEARNGRPRPGLDDKVLTEWNGLMISSIAEAAAVTRRTDWLDLAVAGAEFLLHELRGPDGRWLRSWQGGVARHLAYAADHAAVVDAFTRVAEATGEARWIDEAVAAAGALIELFVDPERGGLFTTGHDAPPLIARQKDILDNATPSANGLAAVALTRLWALTGRRQLLDVADGILRVMAPLMGEHPTAFAHALGAVEMRAGGPTEVIVVGDREDLVDTMWQPLLPNAVRAWGEPYMSPLWEGRSAGLAYVCQGYACAAPTDDPATLAAQLSAATP